MRTHIGATPHVLDKIRAPIYGSKLTLALIANKLKEHRIGHVVMNAVEPRQTIKLGKFSVQFIKVNHSIAGAYALAITSPAGTVLATGDFKIDYTPVDGQVTDLATLAAIGEKGALALLADSTNVEREGHTMSERKEAETFHQQIDSAQGRVIIAMFASNIHRVQQVVDCAISYGRKVCFIGRSMINVSTLAMELGYLVIPRENLLEIDDLDRYRDDQILVLTTGSQGEPMSGLTRMALRSTAGVDQQSDKVIISATPIPGGGGGGGGGWERDFCVPGDQPVTGCGAEVIYEALAEVHVSGHARKEELKLMAALVRPKYFIPVHGEYRMLWQHAELAESMARCGRTSTLPETGQIIIEMNQDSLSISGVVPTGTVLIDGLGIGDVGNVVLRDRKHLSQEGLIIVAMAFDRTQAP